jgi:hypothetical protein
MHPYMHEQMMQAHCADLYRQAARGRGTVARAGRRNRPPLRHDVGWLLVHIGLRLALGGAAAADQVEQVAGRADLARVHGAASTPLAGAASIRPTA